MTPRHGWLSGAARALSAPSAWWRYLTLALVPMVLMPWLFSGQWAQMGVTVGIGYASTALCMWRLRTREGVPVAWLWIGAGLFLNATGSLVEAIQAQVFNSTPAPSAADPFYLALYPCVTVGLLILVRARFPGIGPAKLIDAGTMTVGVGLLCWVFLIGPATGASGTVPARIVDIAYPVGDLMLLAILARVMAADGWRATTVRLLSLGLLCFLFGDTAWALINNNNWPTTNFEDMLLAEPFLLAYALLGAAALHRSSRGFADPARDSGERMSRSLLASLTLASLVAPTLLAAESLAGRVTDGIAIALCSAQLSALVVARTAYLLRHVQRQSERLRDLALEDPLTGLPNRRALQAYLGDVLARARREGRPICIALLDLDRFKHFNDEYGHAAGDHLLKAASAAWKGQVRTSDMLARVGGEEFVLVLPDADIEQAAAVVGKLREATPLAQKFSSGLCQWDGEALPEELLGAADTAMYAAKRAGGDRCERAPVPR
ncbi:MAG TPA: GGDEF domain-containing protein [Solirubrobacteraceae bacterium]|nr:GGDEF domain-containing protein [Solirubrobacteraceae bacterium]